MRKLFADRVTTVRDEMPTRQARAGQYTPAMSGRTKPKLHEALATMSPGTPLREGLDRIVRAHMGALVVLGDHDDVLSICSGGFQLDAPFSPQRLYELAKMDGAIIISRDISRLTLANVHLVPEPTIPTSETGTRHRTAERVARSLDVPVISVSEDMRMIAVYVGDVKHTIEEIPRLLNRTTQATQTLERYKARLDEATAALSALEIDDLVTLRDVVTQLQRSELVRRVADEIATYTVELGSEARLIRLQMDELMSGIDDDREAVIADYLADHRDTAVDAALDRLSHLTDDDLLDLSAVAEVLGPEFCGSLDAAVHPRGGRLLRSMPQLPVEVTARLIHRYGNLAALRRASTSELTRTAGLDPSIAAAVEEALRRITESSILGRYV